MPTPLPLVHSDVEVRVSTRRKKTAGAHWEGDRIVVVVPSHLRGSERDRMVESLAGRLARHRPHLHASDDHLEERARALGRTYLDGVAPASIRWSSAQTARWGSCTLETREIRISERLRTAPPWVLDAVIVHELAHLLEPNHSPRFRGARVPLPAPTRRRPLPRGLPSRPPERPAESVPGRRAAAALRSSPTGPADRPRPAVLPRRGAIATTTVGWPSSSQRSPPSSML